jgi:TRAP-type mannitol/chloroaromatic compound transport system substrate-binding protein
MRTSKLFKAAAGIVLTCGFVVGLNSALMAQEAVRWKVQTFFPIDLVPGVVRLPETVARLSEGNFTLQLHEPGALVPNSEISAALKDGSLDAALTTTAYNIREVPALIFFTSVPFGPRIGEYFAWMRYGGGAVIYDEIYAKIGLKGLPCMVMPPEGSGWFRDEVKSLDDFKGLKMRIPGLGAKVLKKFGVSTYMFDFPRTIAALERRVIDAAEFGSPTLDLKLGIHRFAKHYYFPGWHQPITVIELLMNRDKFEALSQQHKAQIEIACGESITWSFIWSEAHQYGAMQALRQKGVIIHRWPDQFLREFERAWHEVIAEESAKDPLMKRVYESYAAFRKNYAIWDEHGYLK